MTWPHPLTHWPTKPPTHSHPPMGRSVSTNDKSSNRIELSWFSQQFLNFFVIWPNPTHRSSHPPNYTPTLGWGSLHRFQIFKQNWNILISSSAIEFWLIPGSPSWGWGVGGEGVTPTHMHTHVHAHTCVWHHREFPWIPLMGAVICMKLSCLPRMHVRACTCMCTCVGAPTTTPTQQPPPPPRATGSPKHQNSITLELIEIIRFCLKILYLWTFLNS